MAFSETYAQEVLHSRKIRAQRAFFWARVVGLALMISIFAVLRAEPQLRSILMQAGTNGILYMANPDNTRLTNPEPAAPVVNRLPRDRVKVNRPVPQTIAQPQDIQAIAQQVGRALADQR